jgi:hypothetical protein
MQSNIITPLQKEVDGLRAQNARLQGILLEGDPRRDKIIREAQARFNKPAGPKMWDKRKLKLKTLKYELESKEAQVATLLEEIAKVRIECALYAQQVDYEEGLRDETHREHEYRVRRWEEENKHRIQMQEERLEREQRKQARRRAPERALDPRYMEAFIPASAASSSSGYSGYSGYRRSRAEEDDIDDRDV